MLAFIPNRRGKMSIQQQEDPSEPAGERLIHQSSNGDAWYLTEDPATGLVAVKHVSNPRSGGHIAYLEIENFLSGGANGPEHQALRHLIEAGLAPILIAYDIHPAQGAAYDDLVQKIQSLGAWWHHLETVWIVRSERTPEEIRDILKASIGADDQLLVLDISGDRAGWAGVSDAGSKWLRENIER
jgi:hypothetical protein